MLRDLTAIAWATASLEEAPVSRAHFYSQLLLRARPISSMTNHDVANMLWACAKCGAEPNEIHRFTVRASPGTPFQEMPWQPEFCINQLSWSQQAQGGHSSCIEYIAQSYFW